MTRIIKVCWILFLPFHLFSQDLFDLSRVRDIRITFSQSNWEEILDSLKQAGNDERVLASVSVDGIRYDSVGVRYKGNSSYFNTRKSGSSKLPFNIKIDYRKKDQALPGGYQSLKLSNVFRDPSFLREVLAYEIANKYMVSPRANFVRLYVNDRLLGLYNSTESVNKNFLRKKFGHAGGIRFKCDPSWAYKKPKDCSLGDKASLQYLGEDSKCYKQLYEIQSKKGWRKLIHLTKVLNQTPEKIEEVLDVDAVLWMLAFNNVLVNLDSYSGRLCHNYYLYRDTFGIFHPIPWDMNLNFGGFRFLDEGSQLTTEAMQRMSLFIHYKTSNDKRPLITKLLKNSLYRKIYIAHIRSILQDFFSNEHYLTRARQIQQQIDYYVKSDDNKLYTYEAFRQNLESTADARGVGIIGLKELMGPRTEYLKNHPLLKKEPPKITEVRAAVQSGETEQCKISCRASGEEKVYLCFRPAKYQPWQRVLMRDDGAEGDLQSGDGVYTRLVEGSRGLEYYIIAENAKAASLSPERAGKEVHEVR